MLTSLKKHLESVEFGREYYAFWIVHLIVDILAMSFFQVMLYKQTGSFVDTIISFSLNSIVTFVGIVVGSIMIDRIGYLKMYRLSYLISALGFAGVAYLLKDIAVYYPLFSILIFFSRGMFWATSHSIELRESNCDNRETKFNITQGLYLILSVVLTPMVGYILTFTGNYQSMFVLGAMVYLLSLVLPFKYNKVPRSNVTISEIQAIIGNKNFVRFFAYYFVANVFVACGSIVSVLASFIVLKSEFNIGIVISIVSLVGGVMLFVNRSISNGKLVKVGFVSNIIFAVTNILYSVIWSPIALVVNKIVGTGVSGWVSSSVSDQDYRARENLLGKEIKNSAIEINLVTEGIFLMSRLFMSMLFIVFMQGNFFVQEDVIRIGFGISGLAGLVSFVLYFFFNRRFRK